MTNNNINNEDEFDVVELAQDLQFARGIADGSIELQYDDTAPVPELPPVGSPVMTVRPVRLPWEVDQAVQRIAKSRGITMSEFIRGLIVDAVADTPAADDPVTEIRRDLSKMQRALDRLASERANEAA